MRFWIMIVLVSLLVGCKGEDVEKPTTTGRPKMTFSGAVTVQGTEVKKEPMLVMGDYSGDIRTDSQATLSSQVAGRIKSVNVELGDKVEKNQVLATVDKVEQLTKLTQAQATYQLGSGSISEAEAQVKNIENQLSRRRPLLEKNLVTPGEIQNLETQLASAMQRLEVAKAAQRQSAAQLRSAQNSLSNTEIRSPIAGEIAMRSVNIGNYVTPSQTLFRVVDPSTIYVSIRVPEKQSGLVVKGQIATVRVDALGGKSFVGRVKRISPALETSTRTLAVDIVPETRWEGVRPGMFARVQVELARREETLSVLTQAIRKTPAGAPYLWRVEKGVAKKVEVVTGVSNATQTEILSGLKSGDVVILRGQEKVRGDDVKVDLLDHSMG